MIYFDNASTGGFKPNSVVENLTNSVKFLCANPNRSGHRKALLGMQTIQKTRCNLANFFGANSDRVVFTKNCTESLNLAIFGTLKKGGHVITTVYEHNSVLRPLFALEKQGLITLDIVKPHSHKNLVKAIKEKINDKTYLIVTTAVSNVTGIALPVKEIGSLAKEHDIKYLVDGAQAGGHIPLNLKDDNISMLALAGHKGLYGIMGSGVLIFDDKTDIEPLTYGGTGTLSLDLDMPNFYPERLESGTLNLHSIYALLEGANYAYANMQNFSELLVKMTATLINGLKNIDGVSLYSMPNPCGIVAFSVKNIPSTTVADILDSEYDIAVRSGLHCAPLMHKYLRTEENGLVRVSLAVQNTSSEINFFVKAIKEIVSKQIT